MSSSNDNLVKDDKGTVRHIQHSLKPIRTESFSIASGDESPRSIADKYIMEIAPVYGIKKVCCLT